MSFSLAVVIAAPFVVFACIVSILTVVDARKRKKDHAAKLREMAETHTQEIQTLKAAHAKEIENLKSGYHLQIEKLKQRQSESIAYIDDSYKDRIESDKKSYRSMFDRYAESLSENRELQSKLESERSAYEKRIEDLRTIQQIRLAANLKARDDTYHAEMKKAKEKEYRLAIIIRELIESACDCEIPIDTPSGSSSPVPCVYVTKDKIWHITKHRTVSDARTMALHEALLKGYGGCPRCMKNLPPYFRF